MKIGIVGSKGIVGSALKFGFLKLGHEICEHDLLLGTSVKDIINTEIVFIAVPTPCDEQRRCNTRIVESVIEDLYVLNYQGIIVIKSTIIPGTCERLRKEYPSFANSLTYCGEFLRERHAIADFIENNKILAVGTHSDEVYAKVKSAYGKYPRTHVKLTPTQCEMLKYMSNTFGALRVTYANEIKDICDKLGEEYMPIKDAFLTVNSLPDVYFDVNDNFCRGYSSICWNKDVPALNNLIKDLNLDLPIISNIENSNNLHKKTPFSGTRE